MLNEIVNNRQLLRERLKFGWDVTHSEGQKESHEKKGNKDCRSLL